MPITIPSGPPFGVSPTPSRPKREQPGYELTATETYSRNILGPVEFDLCDLYVIASVARPDLPEQVAPANKAQIVERDEQFWMHVKVIFNDTPLTRLLLCLGVDIKITFCAEGCGGQATEVDLMTTVRSRKGEREYDIFWGGTPNSGGLTPGFYAVAAIANIEMSDQKCAPLPCLLGAGYIATAMLQIYDA